MAQSPDPPAGRAPPTSRAAWPGVAMRYVGAVILVAVAHVVTRRMQSAMGESISPLFFAAVAISAGFGGAGPGLLATVLAGWTSAVFYVNPPGTALFWWDDAVRLAVFLVVSLLISSLAHLRRRALAELERANDGLEHRVRDRTAELERSNQQLRDSEERFRALVDGASDYAICMLDGDGTVTGWNAGAERTLGYRPADVAGMSFDRFYPAEDRARGEPAEHLRAAAAAGRDEDEGWRVRRDGSRFWANAILTALHGPADEGRAGRPRGFAHVLRDITDLKRLEKEVLEISETEQRRIGQDLHDGLGQELTGLSFLTQNLRRRLADAGRAEAAEAGRIADLIARTIDQTRDMARGLSPVDWGPDGLAAALRNLAATVRQTYGIPCTAACDSAARVDDHVAAVHLYRIAQEALTNAARHAGATAIDLRLAADGRDLVVTVTDDGRGLPADAAASHGLGLRLMRYRARTIGASLALRTAAGGGTTVRCTYAGAAYADRTGDVSHDRHPARA